MNTKKLLSIGITGLMLASQSFAMKQHGKSDNNGKQIEFFEESEENSNSTNSELGPIKVIAIKNKKEDIKYTDIKKAIEAIQKAASKMNLKFLTVIDNPNCNYIVCDSALSNTGTNDDTFKDFEDEKIQNVFDTKLTTLRDLNTYKIKSIMITIENFSDVIFKHKGLEWLHITCDKSAVDEKFFNKIIQILKKGSIKKLHLRKLLMQYLVKKSDVEKKISFNLDIDKKTKDDNADKEGVYIYINTLQDANDEYVKKFIKKESEDYLPEAFKNELIEILENKMRGTCRSQIVYSQYLTEEFNKQ